MENNPLKWKDPLGLERTLGQYLQFIQYSRPIYTYDEKAHKCVESGSILVILPIQPRDEYDWDGAFWESWTYYTQGHDMDDPSGRWKGVPEDQFISHLADYHSKPHLQVLADSPVIFGEFPNIEGGEYVDLTDARARTHILDGDATGGGHRFGTGISGKSEFPANWSDEEILHHISDVATDPSSARSSSWGGRTVVEGARKGVNIRVILDSPANNGRIVTSFPTNTPRNP